MLTDKETVKFLEDFGDVKTLRELQKVCIVLNIGKKIETNFIVLKISK